MKPREILAIDANDRVIYRTAVRYFDGMYDNEAIIYATNRAASHPLAHLAVRFEAAR